MLLIFGRRLGASLVTAACLLCAEGAIAAGWQDTPDSLKLQPMGDEMVVNGIPMSVREFSTGQPMEKVVAQVQAGWEKLPASSQVKRTSMPPWIVLNQSVGDQHRSFQIRQAGPDSARGFVALSSPAQARISKPQVRLPSDLTPVSIIDSVDNGRSSQQIIATSPRSFEATSAALESSLKASGWERHVMRKNDSTIVFAANKGDQEFDAVLTREKRGSMVMMNTVSRPKP